MPTDKPRTYEIDFELFNEESVFSNGFRLKGRPYHQALAYLFARDVKGRIICEIKGEEITFEAVTIHHRKDPCIHIGKYLGIGCFKHNSSHGSPYARSGTPDLQRESKSYPQPHSLTSPSSTEMFLSSQMFPKTIDLLFHPVKGLLSKLGDRVSKDWLANKLPELVGKGRATTYLKYIREFVVQEYLREEEEKSMVYLIRTGKRLDERLRSLLGIHSVDGMKFKESAKPESKEAATG